VRRRTTSTAFTQRFDRGLADVDFDFCGHANSPSKRQCSLVIGATDGPTDQNGRPEGQISEDLDLYQ
jgi:hypothetical protein